MSRWRTRTWTASRQTVRPARSSWPISSNKPIEEMRAAKKAEVELPECVKREATAEETCPARQGRLTRVRADRPQDADAGAEGRSQRHQDRRGDREGQDHRLEPVEDKPASGSPGPELLAELFNKPIEEMRAAKEPEMPEFLQREPTAEETARIALYALRQAL
jgi:hypothetical protein